MAEKPPEEGYISVVDEEPEIFELLKWDNSNSHTQKQDAFVEKPKGPTKKSKAEVDPFDLPDPTFIETYRLSKDLVRNLCEELKPVMPDSTKVLDFSVESKLLATLSFFATGKCQRSLLGKSDPNVSPYLVTVAMMQVAEAMNHPSIVKKYIHFPHLKEERDVVKAKFYMKYGIPNVIGCVECTHIPITRPDEDQRAHSNKSYHSKKAQIICDSELNVTSVFASPGGSYSHDAILNRHGVRVDLVSLNQTGEQCWLIGGPYYTQKEYIMTPLAKINKKSADSPQKHYLSMHTRAHSAILDTIRNLKSRWKILQATCSKQVEPAHVANIIVACCVLHNLCNRRGLHPPVMTQTEERLELMKQKVANGPLPRKPIADSAGIETRAGLIERLWNERQLTPENSAPKKRTKKDRVDSNQQAVTQQVSTQQASTQQMSHIQQMHSIQQHQMVQHQMHHSSEMEELSKRPRIMTLPPPTYSLNVPSATGHWVPHYPQH